MSILITGAAGFIGYHLSRALLDRGETVVGVDCLTPYYDVALKRARLDRLRGDDRFSHHHLDIADEGALARACADAGVDRVVHLAAQAGVRHSLDRPMDYVHTNLTGHLQVLEFCRRLPDLKHLVYASSSSVYGGNARLPFAEADRVDHPLSLYAATKVGGERMSYTYSHLFRIRATGLRFFTVYGPWDRPDMATWGFTRAIIAGQPITVFNHGDMRRDFTFIDDIVAGVVATLDNPPADDGGQAPHRIYNIGNHRAEPLMRFISVLEAAIGRKAEIRFAPMQPGDVKETHADIAAIQRDIGFAPTTTIDQGLPRFVAWFREYHGV